MGIEFYQTKLGQKFYNSDFPRLVSAVEKLAREAEKESKKPLEKEEGKMKIDFGFVVLVAEALACKDMPGIYLSLEDKDGNFCQSLVLIERAYKDKVAVKVWADGNNDDYTHKIEVKPCREEK